MEGFIQQFLFQNPGVFQIAGPSLQPHPGFKFHSITPNSPSVLVQLTEVLGESLNKSPEGKISRLILINIFENEIFGGKNQIPVIIKEIQQKNPPVNSLCRKSLSFSDIGYKCLDCEKDNTCIICAECFEHGNHTGHRIFRQHGCSGMCDCGDPDAWKTEGFCSKHKGYLTEEDIKKFHYPRQLKLKIDVAIGSLAYCLGQLCEEIYLSRETYDCTGLKKALSTLLSVTIYMLSQFQGASHVLSYLTMSAWTSSISNLGSQNYYCLLKHTCNDLANVCSEKEKTTICHCSPLELLIRFSLVLPKNVKEDLQEFFILFFNFLSFKTSLATTYVKYYRLFFDISTPTKKKPGKLNFSILSSIELQIFTSNEFALQAIRSSYLPHIFDVLEQVASHISTYFDFSTDKKWHELSNTEFNPLLYCVINFLRTVIAMNPSASMAFLQNSVLVRRFVSVMGTLQGMFPFQWKSKIITDSGKFSSIILQFVQVIKQQVKMIQKFIESVNNIENLHFRKELLKSMLHCILKHYELVESEKETKFLVFLPLHYLFITLVHSLCCLKPEMNKESSKKATPFEVVFPKVEEVLVLMESLECEKPKEILRKMTKEAVRAHSFCNMALRGLIRYDSIMQELSSYYTENLFFMDIQIVQLALAAHGEKSNFFHNEIIKNYLVYHEVDIGYSELISPAVSKDSHRFMKNASDLEKTKNLGILRSLLEFSLVIFTDSNSFFSVISSISEGLDLVYCETLVKKVLSPTVNSLLFVMGPKKFKDLNKILKSVWHITKNSSPYFMETLEKNAVFDTTTQLFKVKSEKEGMASFNRDSFLSNPNVNGKFIEAASKSPILLKNPFLLFLGSPESLEKDESWDAIPNKCLKNIGSDSETLGIFISLLDMTLENEKLLEISRLSLSILLKIGPVNSKWSGEYKEIFKKMQLSSSEEIKESAKFFGELANKIQNVAGSQEMIEEKKETEIKMEIKESLNEKKKDFAKQKQEELRKKFQLRLNKSTSLMDTASASGEGSETLLVKRKGSLEEEMAQAEKEHCVFCLGEVNREEDLLFRFAHVQLSNVIYYRNKQLYGLVSSKKINTSGPTGPKRKNSEENEYESGSIYFSACSHLIHRECSQKLQANSKNINDETNSNVCPQCRVLSNVFLPVGTEEPSKTGQKPNESMEIECEPLVSLKEALDSSQAPWNGVDIWKKEPEEKKEEAMEVEKPAPNPSKHATVEHEKNDKDFVEKIYAGLLLIHDWFEPENEDIIVDIHQSFGYFVQMVDLLDFSTLFIKKLSVYQEVFSTLRGIMNHKNKMEHKELWVACQSRLKANVTLILSFDSVALLDVKTDELFAETFFDLIWVLENKRQLKMVLVNLLEKTLRLKTRQLFAAFSEELFVINEAEVAKKFNQVKGLLLPFIKKVLLCYLIPKDGYELLGSALESRFAFNSKVRGLLKAEKSGNLDESEQVDQFLLLLGARLPPLPKDICEWLVPAGEAPVSVRFLRNPCSFRLIDLPDNFKEFSSLYLTRKCTLCGKVPMNPLMICLICGDTICRRSCTERKIRNLNTVTGNCQTHSNTKHCGSSIFASAGDGCGLLVGGGSNFVVREMYLDKYGQSFTETNRSSSNDMASLKLCQKTIQGYTDLILNHSLAAEIRSLIGKKGKSFLSL